MNGRRIQLFANLARAVGLGRATRVAAGWADALGDRPELVADLCMLAFLEDQDAVVADGRVAPLAANELIFRAGARMVARALLDRAGLTPEEIREAMEKLDHEQALADHVARDGAR